LNYKKLQLPLSKADAAELRAGDACLLTGPMFTLRDAGHQRLVEQMKLADGALPFDLEGQLVFYAGPSPEKANRPFGAIGPTTSSRMDFATPAMLAAGLAGTIGKGARNEAVRQACVDNGAVYFVTVGGAAAYLAKHVESCETLAYHDLGTEALRKIIVRDFPVFVGIDTLGNDLYSQTAGV